MADGASQSENRGRFEWLAEERVCMHTAGVSVSH
jgi:hypothetical protein